MGTGCIECETPFDDRATKATNAGGLLQHLAVTQPCGQRDARDPATEDSDTRVQEFLRDERGLMNPLPTWVMTLVPSGSMV